MQQEIKTDECVRRSLQRRLRKRGRNAWQRLLDITDGLCFYCGVNLTPENRTRDHVHPRVHGGVGKRYNLVPACRPCNGAKGPKAINVYRAHTIGNEWFHGERMEIERLVDIGAIDRDVALDMLDSGPLGDMEVASD